MIGDYDSRGYLTYEGHQRQRMRRRHMTQLYAVWHPKYHWANERVPVSEVNEVPQLWGDHLLAEEFISSNGLWQASGFHGGWCVRKVKLLTDPDPVILNGAE
jgi:hypothetical protein